MQYGQVSRLMIMHFIISVIITVMVCFALSTVKIDNIAYLGVFLGVYVFAGYGINRIADEKLIESKSQKIFLVIISLIIFYLFFTYVMPLFFSMSAFGIIDLGNNWVFDSQSMLVIFSAIILILSLR